MSDRDEVRIAFAGAKKPLTVDDVCTACPKLDAAKVSVILSQLATAGELTAEGKRGERKFTLATGKPPPKAAKPGKKAKKSPAKKAAKKAAKRTYKKRAPAPAPDVAPDMFKIAPGPTLEIDTSLGIICLTKDEVRAQRAFLDSTDAIWR